MAGRLRRDAASTTRRRVAIWEAIGDDRELANAYYNASFSYAVGPDGKFGAGDPEGKGEGYVRSALDAFRAYRRRAR